VVSQFLSFIFRKHNKSDKEIKKYLKNIFGLNPKNINIYKIAFIHRSSSVKDVVYGTLNNERLEYLGDAILSAIVADFLFKKFPFFAEGPLTQLRSKIVCRDRLNYLSHKIGLNKLMLINGKIHAKCANGDAFEALIGAMYLDQGYAKTKKIILQKIILTHLDIESIVEEERNYKSKILSWSQKVHKKVEFSHHRLNGVPHNRQFKANLHIDGKLMGEGIDYTVKKAEQFAAEKAWEKIISEQGDDSISKQNLT
jgi:ribonuclease-3